MFPTTPPSDALLTPLPTRNTDAVEEISIQQGYGARKGFWQVLFTAPTGSRDDSTYVGGIDTQLALAINNTRRALDIAAFEFNNPVLTQAVLAARARGVAVRMVTDDEHGFNDADSTIPQFVAAGIPVVTDGRKALMHNKFMILDSQVVWTGSWNYTINDTYRNNNNALAIRAQKVVQDYQAEFDEMFLGNQFGPTSPSNTPFPLFTQNGLPIQVAFAAEDKVTPAIFVALSQAQRAIDFMAFSFTFDDIGGVIETKAQQGIHVRGIFETTGSETRASELRSMYCAGLEMRQDGNPFVLHHKVFIIDGVTIVTGSFNFSAGARDDNDENLIIITDPDLAAQYMAEFHRRWAEAKTPTKIQCQ
jgi:phosphatidylserine/phosphatidylglycerophosphate/cardiolipin synthase-like enzyme